MNSLEPNQVRVSKTRISVAKDIMNKLWYSSLWGKCAYVEVRYKNDEICLFFHTEPSEYGVKCYFNESDNQIHFNFTESNSTHIGTYILAEIGENNCVHARKLY